ncbi:type I restriction enzyme, S subunit [Pseudomonas sp. LAMO17WK12:I10]|uniref:restriction endonuclease subunit S n=1 Tax=unclassified Pseudomonas TaxID=196821 RepID=UPI000BCEC5E6|nr:MULTISPECIES: restriction endonuclease subunit S [unclassified Pseudomonas]PXX58887.1 type I restriction enzyme S subunit [Pseudomonas sp. LAMO17WK12:I9]SNY48254.1 type I restriction enzyme, S subunit [Pseudomonas sp. LAMO17WK12:I10]
MNELPSAWADCLLEDLLGQLENGKVLQQGWSPQCDSVPAAEGEWGVLKTTAIQDGYFLETENKKLPSSLNPKSELEVKAGDLLMTCAGPRSRCGVICHIENTREKLIFSGKIYRFRPNENFVAPKFLTHLLRTSELKEKIDGIKTGISESGMNMTRDRFFSLPVRLAPLNEQIQIAKKLDELLARVDTLKARIDSIPALLKRFRQSVLAAAVSGKLTEEWRLKIASADQRDHSAYLEVPLDSLADFQNGFAFKSDWFSKTGDIQVAKIGNVRNGKVDLSNSPAFVSYTVGSEYQRFMTLEGDILLSMTGTRYKRDYGNACGAPAGILVNQRVGKLRPQRDKVDGRFLLLCLQTARFREQFFSGETGQVSQGNVGSEHIKKCLIPSPPIEEQAEIACRTTQLFAFAEQVEAKVVLAKSRVDHLAQSILAKAFRGELVPQDPNDEPASVLLERIKTQRATAPKARRGRPATQLS